VSVVLITESAGLIGSEAVHFLAELGYEVAGIDNDMRRRFFGEEASTLWNRDELLGRFDNYSHRDMDIRDERTVAEIFRYYGSDISLVIHAEAQPSHDWAAGAPFTDFTVNANGTLVLLEYTRKFCLDAVLSSCRPTRSTGTLPTAFL
jgi:CDP-paratose 2-epimerase